MNVKAMAGQYLQLIGEKVIDYAPQAGNVIKNKFVATIDNAIGADGAFKGVFQGSLDELDLYQKIRIQKNLEKLEKYLEDKTGEDVELNTPVEAVSSIIKLVLEKPEDWTNNEWNFDGLVNTGDTLTKYLTEGLLDKQFSPKNWILDVKENSTNQIKGALESTNAELQEFEVSDLAEIVEADSLVGGISSSLTYVLYEVTKEFLSLEGARRRNEISNGEVVKRVVKTALSSSSKGVVIGLVFSIAILIIGEWLLIPLAIIAPFAIVKMPMNLWNAFWEGLNNEQRQELINSANQLGGNTANFFNSLGAK
ncbi:MAG: hypothetical protein AB4372_40210 [Xenococcus sp. (in: cyanobacteria)]